jgi:hypothetical protein
VEGNGKSFVNRYMSQIEGMSSGVLMHSSVAVINNNALYMPKTTGRQDFYAVTQRNDSYLRYAKYLI